MSTSSVAQLYALLHRGHRGDVSHYRRVCAGASHILELGAGDGRVAIALARAGFEVVGLEIDPAMAALAAEQAAAEPAEVRARLRWARGDMAAFELGRRFDRVLVPYNTLCCLLDPERVRACLEHSRRHLEPGGLLALDVYRADDLHGDGAEDDLPDDAGEEKGDDEPIVALEHDGRVYRVYEESCWQRASQRLDTHYRFVPEEAGEIFEHSIAQRYFLAGELEGLLQDAGFALQQRVGGFLGEPLDEDAEHLVLVASAEPLG